MTTDTNKATQNDITQLTEDQIDAVGGGVPAVVAGVVAVIAAPEVLPFLVGAALVLGFWWCATHYRK